MGDFQVQPAVKFSRVYLVISMSDHLQYSKIQVQTLWVSPQELAHIEVNLNGSHRLLKTKQNLHASCLWLEDSHYDIYNLFENHLSIHMYMTRNIISSNMSFC